MLTADWLVEWINEYHCPLNFNGCLWSTSPAGLDPAIIFGPSNLPHFLKFACCFLPQDLCTWHFLCLEHVPSLSLCLSLNQLTLIWLSAHSVPRLSQSLLLWVHLVRLQSLQASDALPHFTYSALLECRLLQGACPDSFFPPASLTCSRRARASPTQALVTILVFICPASAGLIWCRVGLTKSLWEEEEIDSSQVLGLRPRDPHRAMGGSKEVRLGVKQNVLASVFLSVQWVLGGFAEIKIHKDKDLGPACLLTF